MNNNQKIIQEPLENQEPQEVKDQPKERPSFENLRQFLKKSPYEAMLERLKEEGLSPKEALSEINDLIIAELEENPENSADLERFKARIEQLGREVEEKEAEPISPAIVSRTERDIKFAEGEDFDHPLAMAGILERQNWGKIFTGLKKGDRVLSFLVPGADFLSIKNLNDVIFGPQTTNEILIHKRKVVEREVRKIDRNASMFQSDYKIEIVGVSQDSRVDTDKLEVASLAIDEEMTDFVKKIVVNLIAQEKESIKKEKDENKIKISEERIGNWESFKDELEGKSEKNKGKSGFKMNYGVAEVEGDSMKDKLLSLDHSLETGRMARQNHKDYGAEYSEKSIETELESIKDLREKIIGIHGNTITDTEGNNFEIFVKKGDKVFLNADVLRDVRKGKFKTKDKQVLDDVVVYVKKLNILDVIKPFTMDEISEVEKSVDIAHDLAEKLKKGEKLDDDEVKVVSKMLRSEEKDRAYTSKSEFHKRATAMTECAYVSLDVLDLGVDLLLEYEDILQDIDKESGQKKIDKFNELVLSAGDKTTEKLREFRQKVAEVYKEFGFDGDLITGEVGGDELTLAIDTSKMSEEKLDEFLFALKEKTNTRVIKTVVAKSEKNVSPGSNHQKLIESHLQALKRAEVGAAIAKDIESAERKLNRLLKRQGESAVKERMASLRGLFVLENGQIKSNVVITEKKGVFKVGQFKVANESKGEESYESVGYEFDYEGIRSELESILGKKPEAK